MSIFDFQTQILPDRFAKAIPDVARKWGKFWSRPVSRTLHEVQPWLRFLPPVGRAVVEEVGAIAPLSHLVFESSLDDLRDSMEENRIDRCLILSDPSRIPNEELISIAESDPRFVAAIRVSKDATTEIASAHERG